MIFGNVNFSKFVFFFLQNVFGEKFMKKIIRFLNILNRKKISDLLDSFVKLRNLKSHLSKLIEYRRNGVTRLGNVELFELSKKQRDNSLRMLRCSVTPILFTNTGSPIVTSSQRRPAPPISIVNMPGYVLFFLVFMLMKSINCR